MPSEPITSRVMLWLDERLPVAGARALLAKKVVPAHDQSIWYLLGGITLLAFGLLIVTGVLLAVHYQPGLPATPDGPGAHTSIRRIVQDVPHGWIIRSIHHWSAHLMIAGVMLHLLSTLLMKAYRKPREFTWWTGLILAGLVLGAGFTGYLLPWTSLSFAATRVGTGIAGAAPLAGPLVQKLLLGGSDVTEVTLTRFFGLHVVAIPLAILVLTGVHLALVVVHGSSTPPSRTPTPRSTPFWPDFALRELRSWLLVLFGLVLVAAFLPPPVGTAADLLAPTGDDVRPEWYFLGFYRILKILPSNPLGIDQLVWAMLGGVIVGAALIGLPFLDEPVGGDARARRRQLWPGRLLLAIGATTAWVLSALPGKYLPAGQAAGLNVLAGAVWLGVALILVRMGQQAARAPATLFGCVLALGLVGYVGWEAFGAKGAWVGLAVAVGGLGLVRLRGPAGRTAATVMLWAALLAVIALGGEVFAPQAAGGDATAMHGRVPLARVHETAPPVTIALGMLVFLLAAVQLRIRHQDKLRAMGLRPTPTAVHAA